MTIFCLLFAVICSPVFSEQWKARVVKNLDALDNSCVVVPCTFTYPTEDLPSSRLRGIWHYLNQKDAFIYYKDDTRVLDNFKGRTKLLGELGQKNCTLEITRVRNHDNGPFCFRVELARSESDISTKDKYSFMEDCVKLNMLTDPPKPILEHHETATEGQPYTISCLVTHTCPSHQPSLTWSRGNNNQLIELHREIQSGVWEKRSILVFIPGKTDDHSDITCTSKFYGGKSSSAKVKLYVKRAENHNHIIIPAVVGLSIVVIFSIVCIFLVKKYRRRIAELQGQGGSMMNRLSRLSHRIRSGGPAPFRPEQRLNHVKTHVCADQKIPKPRFPSPKSQPKPCHHTEGPDDGDDYINTADLSVYGNL